jgi:hypothetical protein
MCPLGWLGRRSDTPRRYPAGELEQIVIDGNDLIRLRLSNAPERNLGRMLLAQFSASDRMRAVGQRGWRCEEQCTGSRFASPTTQLTGQVRSGFLEPTNRKFVRAKPLRWRGSSRPPSPSSAAIAGHAETRTIR